MSEQGAARHNHLQRFDQVSKMMMEIILLNLSVADKFLDPVIYE